MKNLGYRLKRFWWRVTSRRQWKIIILLIWRTIQFPNTMWFAWNKHMMAFEYLRPMMNCELQVLSDIKVYQFAINTAPHPSLIGPLIEEMMTRRNRGVVSLEMLREMLQGDSRRRR